jgi:membrane-bound metal-dependent hydrolase YbcI (DUF457 family)
MLPDLDSDSGRPVREVSGAAAAMAPLLLLPRLQAASASQEAALACCAALYLLIRYGLARLIRRASVHRGMFHSIPAMFIAGMIVYLEYASPDRSVRLLLACGVMAGFLSHLLLDELYSVDLGGLQVRLARSAGSAMKWRSTSWKANSICYGLFLGLALVCVDDLQTVPGHWGVLESWFP